MGKSAHISGVNMKMFINVTMSTSWRMHVRVDITMLKYKCGTQVAKAFLQWL
jgi:hypothetical protein